MNAKNGEPIIYDPACYWGHSEAEFSIMTMFGSPSNSFFEGYYSIIPKKEGSETRLELYRLYHYLNHYNIFGSSYRHSCVRIMKQLSVLYANFDD